MNVWKFEQRLVASNLVVSNDKDKDVEQKKNIDDLHTINATATSKILSFLPRPYKRIYLNSINHELFSKLCIKEL